MGSSASHFVDWVKTKLGDRSRVRITVWYQHGVSASLRSAATATEQCMYVQRDALGHSSAMSRNEFRTVIVSLQEPDCSPIVSVTAAMATDSWLVSVAVVTLRVNPGAVV